LKRIVIAGVDGGASSTRCLAVETCCWRVAACKSGPSNILSAGPETTLLSVREAFNGALKKLGYDRAEVVALCLSGAWTAGRKLSKLFRGKIKANKILIKSDVEAAAAACLGFDKQGIIVIAGTGSMAGGKNPEGKIFHCGGWGPFIGDEGSGYWIGVKAINAVSKSVDKRFPETLLVEKIIKYFGLSNIGELVSYIYKKIPSRYEIAQISPLVTKSAEEGDKIAQNILREAGKELALLAITTIRELNYPNAKISMQIIDTEKLLRKAEKLAKKLAYRKNK